MDNGNRFLLRNIGGVCGIVSQIVGFLSLLAAVSISPWFSWTEEDLSVLGVVGPATALFNYGLILAGVLSLIFAISLWMSFPSGQWLGHLAALSLVFGSAALSLVGAVPRTIKMTHNLASLAFFMLMPLAIVLIGIISMTRSRKTWGVLTELPQHSS